MAAIPTDARRTQDDRTASGRDQVTVRTRIMR
jgi:hypothetical protein